MRPATIATPVLPQIMHPERVRPHKPGKRQSVDHAASTRCAIHAAGITRDPAIATADDGWRRLGRVPSHQVENAGDVREIAFDLDGHGRCPARRKDRRKWRLFGDQENAMRLEREDAAEHQLHDIAHHAATWSVTVSDAGGVSVGESVPKS